MAGTRDKKELSPEQVREIKSALDYLSAGLERIASEMESRKIPQITVKKFKTMVKAKTLFIGSAAPFQEGLDSAVTSTGAWELDAPEKIADEAAKAAAKVTRGIARGKDAKKTVKGG